MENIDVIILSYAKNEFLKTLTIQSITTLMASEDQNKIHFNIVVIESNHIMAPFQYENTKTIYPKEKFGFHAYLNIGINITKSAYICLCNNDLIFHKDWASEILQEMKNDGSLLSANPYCPVFHRTSGLSEKSSPIAGYFGVLIGWCIFVKRDIFNIIGMLDENLIFWYCDADYCQSLMKHNIKHCLIPSSRVTHLGSESLKTMNNDDTRKLTQIPRFYYNYKWNHRSYIRYKIEVILYKLKILPDL